MTFAALPLLVSQGLILILVLQSSGFHYLAAKDTPTAERSVDDHHPRVQLKKTFAQNKDYFDEPNHIEQFSKKFVVAEAAVRKYVDHMKLLELKREKRLKENVRKTDAEAKKSYSDYDWSKLFHDGCLAKLKVTVLDTYLNYHNIGRFPNKKAKLEAINLHLAQQVYEHVDEDDQDNESEDQTDESDSDEEHILEEIGLSGSDDDYDNVEGGDILEGPQTSLGQKCASLWGRVRKK
jgi:hypothetical protein